jgi:large subunit ribosomal protein L10
MRPEKQFLVDEINSHLDKGDYVFLTNYERMTVDDIAELRAALRPHGAEFHVVKNTLLNVALSGRESPDVSEFLGGQTAIVCGGEDAPSVAKALLKFTKAKDKGQIKGGLLGNKTFGAEDAKAVSEMPTMPVARATLLGVLNAPAQKLVSVFAAPARDFLGVMQAYKAKLEEAEGGAA